MKLWLVLIFFTILFAGCAKSLVKTEISSFSEEEFFVRTAKFGTEIFRYRIFVPQDRTPGARLPVMLYLHGSDDRGDDNELQLRGMTEHLKRHPQDFPFIIVFPQCRNDRSWDDMTIGRAMAALAQSVNEFDGDERRLYLAGFSLGGYGVWTTAAMYPDKFAAIVPMSGRLIPRSGERNHVEPQILELADAGDPYAAFAQKIGKTPIWIFHGGDDNIVPVANSRKMAAALKNAGNNNVKYTEFPNTGHYSLDQAFNESELFKWLALQHLGG